MKIISIDPEPLLIRGIKRIYYVKYSEQRYISSIRDVWVIANQVAYNISQKHRLNKYTIEFIDNEDIGTDYILYRYRVYVEEKHVASIRIVTKNNELYNIVVTLSLI